MPYVSVTSMPPKKYHYSLKARRVIKQEGGQGLTRGFINIYYNQHMLNKAYKTILYQTRKP